MKLGDTLTDNETSEPKDTTIRISGETWNTLNRMKEVGESFDAVVNRLISAEELIAELDEGLEEREVEALQGLIMLRLNDEKHEIDASELTLVTGHESRDMEPEEVQEALDKVMEDGS
jgi:predicted CopG family antitoxin